MYKSITVFADFHSHSTYSGHAMSSPSEMAEAAKQKRFTYLALTEHAYQYETKSDIENQNNRAKLADIYLTDESVPFYLCGGWEFNNFVYNPAIHHQGLKLLGWHSWFGPEEVDYDDLIADYKGRATGMDILVHPERIATLFKPTWQQHDFLDFICDLAKEYRCAVEFNTSSLRYTTCIPDFSTCDQLIDVLLERLKAVPDVPITIGSDAHVAKDIGLNFDHALEILDNHKLLDRVVNIDRDWCAEFYQKSITSPHQE